MTPRRPVTPLRVLALPPLPPEVLRLVFPDPRLELVPLPERTRDAVAALLPEVDADKLASMKPGALLVNAARGPVVDETSLVDALREGRLGGAALDVYAVEPLPADSPLRALPGVLLSPHAAGASQQASDRILGQSAANLTRVLDGEPVVDVVNGVDPYVRLRR